MLKFQLSDELLTSLTTDGAPALMGEPNGFVALMLKSIPHQIAIYHCIIHHEQLCAKIMEMKNVMEKVVSTVNFIRARELNHRQFKAFFEDVGAESDDVIYFSYVRWLSKALGFFLAKSRNS